MMRLWPNPDQQYCEVQLLKTFFFFREPSLLFCPAHSARLTVHLLAVFHGGGEGASLPALHHLLLQSSQGHPPLHGVSASQKSGRHQGDQILSNRVFAWYCNCTQLRNRRRSEVLNSTHGAGGELNKFVNLWMSLNIFKLSVLLNKIR